MCGIVGFTGEDENYLARANSIQKHRGPDGEGFFHEAVNQIHMAMTRLAIVDKDGGKQPMKHPDRQVVLVFNGEIINAPELRAELEKKGVEFSSLRSDTETLLHLYCLEGPSFVRRLNGMFAFVIYDAEQGLLHAARDRFGIKPLFYSLDGNRFSFASELKALMSFPWIDRNLNRQSIRDFLALQFIPAPHTPFAGAQKLPAAHQLTYSTRRGSLSMQRFWSPKFGGAYLRSDKEVATALRTKLAAAVGRWSDVEQQIAFSLSGGIDSSGILAMYRSRVSSQVDTFSVGVSGFSDHNELDLARLVAERLQTRHHEVDVSLSQIAADLPTLLRALDAPYAGGLPSWYLFQKVRAVSNVCMVGIGGDELFGNYRKWHPYTNVVARIRRIGENLGAGYPAKELGRYRKALLANLYVRDWQQRCVVSQSLMEDTVPAEENFELQWRRSSEKNPRSVVAAIDFANQLPEEFLHVNDSFSMAFGVEARPPFLDNDLVDFALALSPSTRSSARVDKQILRRALASDLPTEVITGPKKGFTLPLGELMRNPLQPLVHETFIEARGAEPIFQDHVYKTIIKPFLDRQHNQTQQVWTMFTLQFWNNARNT